MDDDRALSLLVGAAADLLSVPQLEQVIERVSSISRRLLAADAYAVWQLVGGRWQILHSAGLSDTYKAHFIAADSSTMARLAEPFVVEQLESSPAIRDRLPLYRSEGIESLMAFPLDPTQAVVGSVAFYFRQPRELRESEVRMGAALTTIITAAIRNAETYEEQFRLRREAELGQTRWSFLAEATALLNSSLDYESTLQRVAQAAVPKIADWCAVSMSTETGIETLAVWHSDPEKLKIAQELHRLYPPHTRPQSPIVQVLKTGQTLHMPQVTDEMIVATAQDERHLRLIRSLGLRSVVLAPIRARAGNIGTLTLVTAESVRQIAPADVELAESLAMRAATAIENAKLYRELEQELRRRIEAQQALHKAEERLREAQVAAKLGAFEWDVRAGKVSWSPEIPSLRGVVPDGDVSKWRALIHPEDRLAMEAKVRGMGTHSEIELEYRIMKPDGSVVWILSRGKRIFDASGAHVHSVGVAIDITDRKLAETAFQRAEKLAAAGRLAATIAHEINNPLEAVTNLLFLAQSAPDLAPPVRDFLQAADEELKRIAHLTKQTLGFYREQGAPEEIEIAALVNEVVQMYRGRLLSKKVEIKTRFQPRARTRVVKGELRQIISNLMANAIDACSPGGVIHLRVSTSAGRGVKSIHFTIADSGPGISADDQKRLFEPFFTTKKDVGTGLGLWVSRQLAQKNGGTLTFRSRTRAGSSGTVFRLRIPASN